MLSYISILVAQVDLQTQFTSTIEATQPQYKCHLGFVLL